MSEANPMMAISNNLHSTLVPLIPYVLRNTTFVETEFTFYFSSFNST